VGNTSSVITANAASSRGAVVIETYNNLGSARPDWSNARPVTGTVT